MRALIIASASRDRVIDPSSTCVTNSLTRSFPRSREAGSRASLPCSTIWSSRPASLVVSVAGAAAVACCGSLIGTGLLLDLRLQLFAFVGVSDGIHQKFLQFVVALERSSQIRQLRAEIQKLAKRLHLPRHVLRREVVHALEMQVHLQLRSIGFLAQLVLHAERKVRLHAL